MVTICAFIFYVSNYSDNWENCRIRHSECYSKHSFMLQNEDLSKISVQILVYLDFFL